MAWIVAVYIPGARSIDGLRWNREFTYYTASRGMEVFAKREDAVWAMHEGIAAEEWIKNVISVEQIANEPFSVGVAVCKYAQAVAKRTGYYPAKREVHEIIAKVCQRNDLRQIRAEVAQASL